MISYNDLLYFTELTSTLNFSRAAERIGISQPSLTAAIKRLEQFLETELFIRDKHKVLLTQSGKNLLAHTKKLFQLWESTKANCLYSMTEVQGSITLGCHHTIALYFLPKCISTLVDKYPNLEIKLKHDLSRKIAEEIINYAIDIGIVVNPIKHPDLIIKKLLNDYIGCWKASNKRINDKINIICDPELHQTQWILKKLKSSGFHYHKMITTTSLEVIAHLTAEGVGIGILPACLINTFYSSSIVNIPQTPVFNDEICLVYRHENRNIQAVKMVAKEIREINNDLFVN